MDKEEFRDMVELERGLEAMELRILESIWSLERAVLDELDALRKLQSSFDLIQTALLKQKFGSARLDLKP